MLRLRGLALAYRRRRTLLLAKLAQNAAREQNAPLPWRELGEECYLFVSSPQWDLLLTVLQAFAQVRKFPLVALLELLVVRLVCELQGENALGDQIPPVDAGEALSYHRSDAEVQRGQGRVLAATTLTVVVPANDKARRHLLGLLVVLRVEAAEGETGDLGHVRAEGHYLHPIWREVGDLAVVHRGVGRSLREGRVLTQLARVGDDSPERRRRRGGRARQVHLIGHRSRPSRAVTIEGPYADRLAGWRLSHPDARAAYRFKHPGACAHEVRVYAAPGDSVEDLAASRSHGHDEARVDHLFPQDRRRDRQVVEARVDRAANAHLSDLRAGDLAHRDHVARRVGLRDQRLQSVQLDVLALVVVRSFVGGQPDEVFRPLLHLEPLPGPLV